MLSTSCTLCVGSPSLLISGEYWQKLTGIDADSSRWGCSRSTAQCQAMLGGTQDEARWVQIVLRHAPCHPGSYCCFRMRLQVPTVCTSLMVGEAHCGRAGLLWAPESTQARQKQTVKLQQPPSHRQQGWCCMIAAMNATTSALPCCHLLHMCMLYSMHTATAVHDSLPMSPAGSPGLAWVPKHNLLAVVLLWLLSINCITLSCNSCCVDFTLPSSDHLQSLWVTKSSALLLSAPLRSAHLGSCS